MHETLKFAPIHLLLLRMSHINHEEVNLGPTWRGLTLMHVV